jgi:hypothetical protein
VDSKKLRWTLQNTGFSEPAISAAWPSWWSDDAEASSSAQVELRFSLARKLGLDPRSLLNDEPRFVWPDAKFKHLSTDSEAERNALSSYGTSIGRILLAATESAHSIQGATAQELRAGILAKQQFVRLVDLLGLCWAVGIPVAHLRVFPLTAKRMCAMAIRAGVRFALLLGRDSEYPASIAYYVAHELGHIALGHIRDGEAVVDLGDPLESAEGTDQEEDAADRFALELLTGTPKPAVSTETRRFTAAQLAQNVLQTASQVRIEPGTLALCFGHTTGDWPKANAAMRAIYTAPQPVWAEVNQVAARELDWTKIPEDTAFFVRAVIGGTSGGGGS